MKTVNVLLITEHFPPDQGGGAGRPYSLYKYLPEFGVNVTVITTVPETKGKDLNEFNDGIYRIEGYKGWRNGSWYKKITRLISIPWFRFFHIYPDLLWFRNACKEVGLIIQKHQINLVYASFPGSEVLRLGVKVSQKYNLPLITEFRDGLVFESIIRRQNVLQRKVVLDLEKSCINQSKAIVTIGNVLTGYFRNQYQLTNVYTVFNGYDLSDFAMVKNATTTDHSKNKFHVYHFGSLNSSRATNRVNLFQAIARLKQTGEISSAWFRLFFIGRFTNEELEMANQYGLTDIMKFCKPLERKEGIALIHKDADALLFYGVEGEASIISSKLPEYLMMNKPILGICNGNEAEEIIKSTATGETCGFDVHSITGLFKKAISGDIKFQPNTEVIRNFDRRNQAGEVARVIKQILLNNE